MKITGISGVSSMQQQAQNCNMNGKSAFLASAKKNILHNDIFQTTIAKTSQVKSKVKKLWVGKMSDFSIDNFTEAEVKELENAMSRPGFKL